MNSQLLITKRKEEIKEGKKVEKKEIAKKMINMGIDVKVISDITGLSIDEINKIK